MRVCVVCAHDVCLFGARPATRSPSTTNAARTVVVSARRRLYRVSRTRELETSPNRSGLTFARKEPSKRAKWKTREERRRDDEEGRLVTLVSERLKDDSGEVGLWQTRVARGAFNSISSGRSEIRKIPI